MNKLRVLMYHKVSETKKDYLTVTSTQLSEQLNWLKQRYNFITLRDLTKHTLSGTALPENALLITFDDGYENNYTLAYPIFKELEIPFSIFLVSSFIGKKTKYDGYLQKFLSIEQLHHMQDLVQYGFHSFDHQNLMDHTENKWQEEISKGVANLMAFPVPIESAWAYTYGSFPKKKNSKFEKVISAFKSNDITCAFRIGNRINNLPISEPYAIERIDIRGNEGFSKFKWKVRFGKLF